MEFLPRLAPLLTSAALFLSGITASASGTAAWNTPLLKEAETLGKTAWRPLLRYTAELHQRSTHPAEPPFKFDWEEIGPGYGYGPAFGHWDVIHQILDSLPAAPAHAREQLLNDLRLQLPSGFLPGVLWMPMKTGADGVSRRQPRFDDKNGHPPVWVVAADEYLKQTGDRTLLREFYERATRQIGWFNQNRATAEGGYFYTDISLHVWESGVDEGVRFDDTPKAPRTCIDATCHVYQLHNYAALWAAELGENPAPWAAGAEALRTLINRRLWHEESGFYFDIWAVEDPRYRHQAYEGLWPLIVGAATQAQADRVIREWVLNPGRFLTTHPVPTVGAGDPKFELRMWRGPAWNSMTYWAARACVRYGHPEAARQLLEAALDDTAAQFARTGTLWEFFHPHGGKPEELARKPHHKRNQPWPDYLGHNPVFAMTRLWQSLPDRQSTHP